MNCPFCNNDQFYAHQMVRMDVIVDSDGDFLCNDGEPDVAIYDADKPYGPFTCTRCGAIFENLTLNEIPTDTPTVTVKPDGPVCYGKYNLMLNDEQAQAQQLLTIYMSLPRENYPVWEKALMRPDMAMNLLRARISGFLTTQAGWNENCKANKRFCWSDLPACLPMHACGLYLTPFDTAAPIVATVNRIQDTNELLAPANVPAVMEFDMPDGTRLQKHCAVNFQTGDIYGVIAPADASDACVIIPFTDKILPCRPGPTPSLKPPATTSSI